MKTISGQMCIRDRIWGNHILKIDSFLHVFDSFHHRGHGGHRLSLIHIYVRMTLNQKATSLNKEKQDFQKKLENNAFLSQDRAQDVYKRQVMETLPVTMNFLSVN